MQTIKMVVTGAYNSGKTKFIKTVSEIGVVNTEKKVTGSLNQIKKQTTVAMDFGRISVDQELVLYLFGTPGQKRFDFMWEILSEGMLGFILMVDSTRPETFRETRMILETFRSYSPSQFVIAANKQDLPDAWNTEDLRIALRLEPNIKIVSCSSLNIQDVKEVLLQLLNSILENLG